MQVELWLNKVLDTMRATVRYEMSEAVLAYGEKTREQWLFDYPAQVCTSILEQIFQTFRARDQIKCKTQTMCVRHSGKNV